MPVVAHVLISELDRYLIQIIELSDKGHVVVKAQRGVAVGQNGAAITLDASPKLTLAR